MDALPPNAVANLPVLVAEWRGEWPEMAKPWLLAGQIEQETCISLKHKRCWSRFAELRTERERGIGLGQITKTAKFDRLAEIKAQYPGKFDGWSWDNPYITAYQLRAMVLMDRQAHDRFSQTQEPYAFMFAAYNGGIGGVLADRAVCRVTEGCNVRRWFGHVERTSRKAKTALAGYGQSFYQINRAYVINILNKRSDKYRGYSGWREQKPDDVVCRGAGGVRRD